MSGGPASERAVVRRRQQRGRSATAAGALPLLAVVVGLALPPWFLPLPAAAQTGLDRREVERRAHQILASSRFQRAVTRRPAELEAERTARSESRSGANGQTGDTGASQPDLPAPPAGAARGAALLFEAVLVCVVLALLGAAVTRWLGGRKRGAGAVAAAAMPARAGDPGPPRELADAERLAAAGRYGEAVHELLLVAIDRLSRRAVRRPAPSRTSRELVRLLPLEGAARDAFVTLVGLVETTLFGGASAGPADFAAARASTLMVLSAGGPGGTVATRR